MDLIWQLIVGGVLGAIAGSILGKDIPGGIIGNIVAGFLGAWVGGMLFGAWGPAVGGFYILPALVGAVILIFIVSLVLRNMKK